MASGFWRLIEDAAKRSDFRPTLEFWRSVWPSLVGPEIARRSMPCGWHGQTLIVEVEAGAWESALETARPRLLGQLGTLPWPVRDIEFVQGHFDAPKAAPVRDLEQVELPKEAHELLDEDLDEEIAAHAARIRLHLEWEKKMSDEG